jgi:alanine racemase
VETASQAARLTGKPAQLHLKVDTGMSRIGVQPAEALDLARRIAGTPGVVFEGIFTHFARADEADPTFTDMQERRFQQVFAGIEAAGLRPACVHAANSPAALTRPETAYDLIRLGIAMYGLHPSGECPLPEGFRPALVWKTVLTQVKTLPAGSGVSYNHEYVTQKEECIGTLPVGYADGWRRARPNLVLVGGQRAPVVGRVCMDQCMLNLDTVPGAREGDEVILIGSQGEERISAEELARRWGTNNYDVMCGIGARVPRIYSGISSHLPNRV